MTAQKGGFGSGLLRWTTYLSPSCGPSAKGQQSVFELIDVAVREESGWLSINGSGTRKRILDEADFLECYCKPDDILTRRPTGDRSSFLASVKTGVLLRVNTHHAAVLVHQPASQSTIDASQGTALQHNHPLPSHGSGSSDALPEMALVSALLSEMAISPLAANRVLVMRFQLDIER